VHDYCASAAMPLAGAKRLRAVLVETGKRLPPELAKKFDAAETWLRGQAKRILRGSSRVGKDGVRIFTPDATGGYGAFWVRDWSYAIEGCPEAFTREEIRDGYLFLAAAQREDGCMPDRVRADGKGVYSPGGEVRPLSKNGSVDQSPFMVILCHQYWRLYNDLDPFRRTAGALEKAMRFTPRNPANGLVTITDATLFRPYSFLDTVPLVGDQQFDSVLFWDAYVKLAEMFTAVGQPDRAAPWRHEAERVKKSLATLWDDKLGLFDAASEKWRQPSVWGSLFAVYAGIATPKQRDRIERYCLDNNHLIVCRGQVRHLPKGAFWGRPEPEFAAGRSGTTQR
jgi:glycogen debranching enzyme